MALWSFPYLHNIKKFYITTLKIPSNNKGSRFIKFWLSQQSSLKQATQVIAETEAQDNII